MGKGKLSFTREAGILLPLLKGTVVYLTYITAKTPAHVAFFLWVLRGNAFKGKMERFRNGVSGSLLTMM